MKKKIIRTDVQENKCDQITSSLRPSGFDGYIGQEDIKRALKISIASAKTRDDALGHTLFYGPPGLGKTTLAGIIANEMGTKMHTLTGASIEKAGDIASILSQMNRGDILFIDEIHRMDIHAEEVLYSAMEDFQINITVGRGGCEVKTVALSLEPFTLVGATTRVGMLTQPLRDRFGHIFHLEWYTDEELSQIIINTANMLGFNISKEASLILAQASRGTPRLANRNFLRARDYAMYEEKEMITKDIALRSLEMSGIDTDGLDAVDRKILTILSSSSRPTGLKTLAMTSGEDEGTIELAVEPYLLQKGLIEKTPQGRLLTEKGRIKLGIPTACNATQLSFC